MSNAGDGRSTRKKLQVGASFYASSIVMDACKLAYLLDVAERPSSL